MNELMSQIDEKFNNLATGIWTSVRPPDVVGIDPAVILAIIELLKNLAPIILEQCNKQAADLPELAEQYLSNDTGVFKRMWFRLLVRRKVGGHAYAKLGGVKLPDSIADCVSELTPQTCQEMFDGLCCD